MNRLYVAGGKPLSGETYVSGGKNTSVAVIPAVLLCDEPCTLENVPNIEDVRVLIEILNHLGATVTFNKEKRELYIDPTTATQTDVPNELTQKMRASYYFLGALLGKNAVASVGLPGGCQIGARPIDLHIKGFMALGAEVVENGYSIKAEGELKGGMVYFDRVTVGGTINVMLAAVKAKGRTCIYGAAKEPHIVDVANFLNSMGANIKGAGTDTIRIKGVCTLKASRYAVIPDQIETGTLMIMAAATRGDVTIHGCIPTHMEALTAKLLEMGVGIEEKGDSIRVFPVIEKRRAINLKTSEYPGFPTDLQQAMSAFLCVAKGKSVVHETIFENRFNHLREMQKMGANVSLNGQIATIEGVEELRGALVNATDLRAGAALLVAALIATGTTTIVDPGFIERGYEHIKEKLIALGADIIDNPVQ